MARITTIANQKGGVGKTTTAHALATGLAYRGHRVLAIDADPQGNLTYTMNADEAGPGVYEEIKGTAGPQETVQHTAYGDIIAGSLLLAGADMEFTDTGREYLLADALGALNGDYDFIIIDSPPQLGILTINTLTAARDLVIPMSADIYSLQGLSRLYATIGKVRRHCNPSLRIAGLLITRYSGRAILSKELKEIIEDKARQLETRLYTNVIREGISVREAQTKQTSVFKTAFKSNTATDYMNFIDEYTKEG